MGSQLLIVPPPPPPAAPDIVTVAPAAFVDWLKVMLLPPASTSPLVLVPDVPDVFPMFDMPASNMGTPILITVPFVEMLTAPVADRLETAGAEKLMV
jgi:hypothetical protein